MEKSITPREQIHKQAEDFAMSDLNEADFYDATSSFKYGAEYGYNLAIEKVFELLENIDFEQRYLDSENLFHKEQFIENLKQAMKL